MSFGRRILEAFAAHGDKVAMVSDRSQITYAQALIQIRHLAVNSARRALGQAIASASQWSTTSTWSCPSSPAGKTAPPPVVIDFRTPRR
jgi:hypothetical protein